MLSSLSNQRRPIHFKLVNTVLTFRLKIQQNVQKYRQGFDIIKNKFELERSLSDNKCVFCRHKVLHIMLIWKGDRVKEKHRVTSSIILAFLKFKNIQWKNNSIFFAGENKPRIVYFVAKRVGFTEVLHNEIIYREVISEKYIK
jgi:hypothetical protein